MAAHGCSFCLCGVGGGVAGGKRSADTEGGVGDGGEWGVQASNQSLFLPRTLAEQETSDPSLLCFSRCCSPAGK